MKGTLSVSRPPEGELQAKEPAGLPTLRPVALRGKAYFDELKSILKEEGPAILADVASVREDAGRLTIAEVCRLALKYRLNLKATFDFLEDEDVIPFGTYESLKDRGMRPMTALREVWAKMQEVQDQ